MSVLAAWYTNVTDPNWWEQFLHPGKLGPGGGYWFYSGIFALSYLGGLLALIGGLYRHHNCHVDGCRKLGHLDPAIHAPACRVHHSLGHLHGTPPPKKGTS